MPCFKVRSVCLRLIICAQLFYFLMLEEEKERMLEEIRRKVALQQKQRCEQWLEEMNYAAYDQYIKQRREKMLREFRQFMKTAPYQRTQQGPVTTSNKVNQTETTNRQQNNKKQSQGLFSRIMGFFSKSPKQHNMAREQEGQQTFADFKQSQIGEIQ